MASISAIFASFFMLFMDTIFSNYLLSIGVSEHYIGYIFALNFTVYAISAPLVGKLCEKTHKLYLT
jgi:MFS family permease